MDKSLGVLLRRHRHAAGLTQEALAEKAGLSYQAIGALERGARRFPRRDTVHRLADALGLVDDQRAELAAAAVRRPGAQRTRLPLGFGVPRQLPPDLARFTGRGTHVRAMIELLGRSHQAVVLTVVGMGGVGKTALAVHVGHRVAARFPDGQLYLDLGGDTTPLPARDALEQLMRVLGDTSPGDITELVARYRSSLAGRRMLLILDNAAHVEQVAPLLPATDGCAAIITSRRAVDTLPQAHHFQLDVFSEREALDLLAGSAGLARIDAERDAAAALVRHCGQLPLAVHLVGARLASRPGWPVAHLAQRLADEHRRLDELERDDVGVRASFAVSVDHLDQQHAAAYALLGLLDSPDIRLAVAARLLDMPELTAERLLERLSDLHLLEPALPGRYRMHDLLRAYARERAVKLVSDVERAAALRRVVTLFIAVAWRSLALVVSDSVRQSWADPGWAVGGPDFTSSADAFAWLDEHRHHLVGISRAPGVPPELLVRLAPGLFAYYLSRGHWLDWSQVNRAALNAASAGTDRLARAIINMDLGIALADLAHARSGSHEEALIHLARSLADFTAVEHRQGIAGCLTNTSEVLQMCGDLEAAITCGEESLAICGERGLRGGEAAAHEHLGSLYGDAGQPERELAHYRASLHLNEQLGHDRDSASVLRRIGNVHRRSGKHPEALAALARSRALFHMIGDPVGEATALEDLGQLHLAHRDHDAAREVLLEGLAIAEEYDDRQRQASCMWHLGFALMGLGLRREAEEYWQASAALSSDR